MEKSHFFGVFCDITSGVLLFCHLVCCLSRTSPLHCGSYLRVMVASLQLFSSPVLFECSRVDARLQTVSNLSYKCSIIRRVGDAEVFDGARRKLVGWVLF